MTQQHRIDIEQNKAERIELLRAQRLFYARAKNYQSLFATLALALPLLGVLFGARAPWIRPYLGLASILILLLDVGVFSRKQREDCRRGAKVQEQFDTEVLGMPWNRLVAGGRVDAEEIREITSGPLIPEEQARLEDWYEPIVAGLPLAVGRIFCQRTNVTYDMRVRKEYAGILFWFAIVLWVTLSVFGLLQGLNVEGLLLTMYVPALPVTAFLLREHRKQNDTIETLTTLKTEVDKLWEKALSGSSAEELTLNSRAIQDAIYRHRATNPLVFDWLYSRLRARNEDVTRHAAEKLVAEAEQKLKSPEVQ